MVNTFTSSWLVQPTNQLAANFYSPEDYETVAQLTPFANGILGLYLTVVAVTMVFRKFIGLELASLMQIGYLSILQNT